MALQIAKFAAANKATEPQTSPATLGLSSAKPATGLQLITDFARCTTSIVNNSVSDLRNHQGCLAECQGTNDIKIKGMNRDAKNSQ